MRRKQFPILDHHDAARTRIAPKNTLAYLSSDMIIQMREVEFRAEFWQFLAGEKWGRVGRFQKMHGFVVRKFQKNHDFAASSACRWLHFGVENLAFQLLSGVDFGDVIACRVGGKSHHSTARKG